MSYIYVAMKRFFTILIFTLCLAANVEAEGYDFNDIVDVQTANRYRFVVNPDGIISDDAVKTLDSLCYSLRHRGIAQVSIVAINNIGYPPDPYEFAMKLFSKWGVGNKERNNGLGILLVKDMREIRFVTGYGLEAALPDAMCVRIQRNYMLPHFRNDDYSTGMVEGLRAIDTLLTGGELDQGLTDDYKEDETDDMILAFILVLLMVVLPIALFLIHAHQTTKCPNCGKHGLKVTQSIVTKNTSRVRITEELLVCSYCGSQHKRTKREDKPQGGGGGPIIFGGFGGGRGFGGGGGFGGGFGGGSFGGGGGGSRW